MIGWRAEGGNGREQENGDLPDRQMIPRTLQGSLMVRESDLLCDVSAAFSQLRPEGAHLCQPKATPWDFQCEKQSP